MATDISIKRLRRICADSDAKHAALLMANENLRRARSHLADAKLEQQRFEDAQPAIVPRRGIDELIARHRANYAQAVKAAEEALDYAEDAHADAHTIWAGANALATSARVYAREHGALPRDLEIV